MKKYILVFIVALSVCSCSMSTQDEVGRPLTPAELEKLETVKQMFIEYGWEVNENPTREEINEALNADLDSLRDLLEMFNNDSISKL